MENFPAPYHYPQNVMQDIDFFTCAFNMRDIFMIHNIYVKLQDNYVIMQLIYLIINNDYDCLQNNMSTCVLFMSTCYKTMLT